MCCKILVCVGGPDNSLVFTQLSALAMPLIPDYELFSERVNAFKPEKQILG